MQRANSTNSYYTTFTEDFSINRHKTEKKLAYLAYPVYNGERIL